MDIATIIQRLHPELDPGQREFVGHSRGPLLVIAGPGAGKTRCVALRAVNLLLTGETSPGELVLCTFGRDAARELERRFTGSALACGVPGDPSRVRISTIHSLCHGILAPHAGLAGCVRDTVSWTSRSSTCCCIRSSMASSVPSGTCSPDATGETGCRWWPRPPGTLAASATN